MSSSYGNPTTCIITGEPCPNQNPKDESEGCFSWYDSHMLGLDLSMCRCERYPEKLAEARKQQEAAWQICFQDKDQPVIDHPEGDSFVRTHADCLKELNAQIETERAKRSKAEAERLAKKQALDDWERGIGF
jgi:hypothetical protein